MVKLLLLREKLNLTQDELSEKSGVSVRTIQRIEAGQVPSGYTLKTLAKSLDICEADLRDTHEDRSGQDLKWTKVINLSSLPFVILPPLNLFIPLIIIFAKKQDTPANRKLISIQVIWTLIGILLLILVLVLNDWYGVRSRQTMLIPLVWTIANAINILANAVKISKGQLSRISPPISIL
ncbi:helix-turn-helix transcriptional regulator [Dyadobacter sp. LHD-138]|uniref:helix-turn-helix domain-containing protein n=1 Tax=Dyadobacter sp. LHD-138 TaxID=3071413 RepID=UPI0027E1A08B|nr:helix-turn-helix transcriptional regulator [Dyadobacter sp. LHD-138]MDQ6480518.1 helix-turn-helix transcriptional regulator [Dyadobacter sp. LHD-138]